MTNRVGTLLFCLLMLTAQGAFASGTVRRFALVAGANSGGAARTTLRYAVSDAEHFAHVLETMGGVDAQDRVLLRQPDAQAFSLALELLRQKLAAVRGEAYQFAFHETLSRTARTQAGAQHPAYDIKLAGTGDVVMTDVRETSSGLVLDETLNGRFFVRNSNQQLVAELFKPAGRTVELGLEPGSYDIQFEREPALFTSSVDLEAGQRLVLDMGRFSPADRDLAIRRGDPAEALRDPYTNSLAKRHRLELRMGWSQAGGIKARSSGAVTTDVGLEHLLASFAYGYWVRERVGISLMATILASDVNSSVGSGGTSNSVENVVSVLLGVKTYLSGARQALRPYIMVAAGPYIGSGVIESTGTQVVTSVQTTAAFGGHAGGGVDMPLGRHFMLGVTSGYNLMMDFPEPLGGKRNYSGLEAGVSLSWVFGKGIQPGM